MDNEELTVRLPDLDWGDLNNITPNTISPQYDYYNSSVLSNPYNNINFYEFKNKLLEEIQFKIRHLEQSLEVVREKNSKQFIKGQIVALNEIRCSIERNDWACNRGEYYV